MRVKQKNHLRCKQSFKVNGPAAPCAKFPSTCRNFWPTAEISTPSPTPFLPDHKSHFPFFPLPSFLSYSRFLALTVSHPTAGVAMVFFKDLSSGSSSGDYSFTTRVCLSSLSRAMTWNEGFLPGGRFESFIPLVAPFYLLSMRLFSLEEERVMQQSSVSISLSF